MNIEDKRARECTKQANRPSADFFHSQASRCAPPQHLAQLDDLALQLLQGPDLPATRAVLPASKNSAFHPPIDCSLTFSPRAASAMDTSPANTFNTIRHRGPKDGLPMLRLSFKTYTTPLPHTRRTT